MVVGRYFLYLSFFKLFLMIKKSTKKIRNCFLYLIFKKNLNGTFSVDPSFKIAFIENKNKTIFNQN